MTVVKHYSIFIPDFHAQREIWNRNSTFGDNLSGLVSPRSAAKPLCIASLSLCSPAALAECRTYEIAAYRGEKHQSGALCDCAQFRENQQENPCKPLGGRNPSKLLRLANLAEELTRCVDLFEPFLFLTAVLYDGLLQPVGFVPQMIEINIKGLKKKKLKKKKRALRQLLI